MAQEFLWRRTQTRWDQRTSVELVVTLSLRKCDSQWSLDTVLYQRVNTEGHQISEREGDTSVKEVRTSIGIVWHMPLEVHTVVHAHTYDIDLLNQWQAVSCECIVAL